ncbi:MAG: c-type cytochrome [Rhodobacteraceae bacterium]|nr:c-type cytochrome [Paracoccaceae bacterium]
MRLPLAALALILAALPAAAQEEFDLEGTVAMCVSCHGEDGVPVAPEFPVISGQQYFYIYTQLRDFGAGRRDNDIMTPISADLSRDQAKLVAQAIAEMPWPEIAAEAEEGDRAAAESAFTAGQCSACHGKWQGDSRIPRLAGQQSDYLIQTMLDLKHKTRANAPDMSNIMADMDEDQIGAMGRYLATLTVQ